MRTCLVHQPQPSEAIQRTKSAAETALKTAVSFGDRSIVSELLQGIRDDARCQRGTLLCAPHGGALRHFEQAAAKLAKTEQRGWGSSHAELPCWPR